MQKLGKNIQTVASGEGTHRGGSVLPDEGGKNRGAVNGEASFTHVFSLQTAAESLKHELTRKDLKE